MAAALKLSWYDDLKAESDLRRRAVTFEKTKIPFSSIDLKESQVNGARIGDAIVEHKVEDYMQGFRNGDTFPRPIVHKTSSGYVILSGNQRCEAIRRLIKEGELQKNVEIEVYFVDTTDKLLLEIIARTANVSHGEGSNKEERIHHAVYSVRKLGCSTKEASKDFVVSQTAINLHLKADEVRATLQRAGVEAHNAAATALVPLAQLPDESAQIKMGTLTVQHKVPAEEVRRVVTVVAKQTSPQARMAKIKEFEKELAQSAHATNGRSHETIPHSKVPSRPRREKFIGMLTRMVNFLTSENAGEPFTTLDELQITSQSEQQRVLGQIKSLRYRLGVLVK